MAKLSHARKVQLARRLRTPDELIHRVPLFESEGWEHRKDQIRLRVLRQQTIAHYHAERKKAEKKGESQCQSLIYSARFAITQANNS